MARKLPWCLAAAMLLDVLAGCGGRGPAAVGRRLKVVARPFALAEVARRVGLDRVAVSDQGDVVLGTGGDPDPWLDPVAMQRVTKVVADSLSRADPTARPAYQAAARAYQAQLGALDIDYRSSLADCGRHDIVTADNAFTRLATRYNFTDRTVSDAGIEQLVESRGIPTVYTEPMVAPGPAQALAHSAHIATDVLDTLTARTPAEAARGATYLSLMTDNLAKLRTALACTA